MDLLSSRPFWPIRDGLPAAFPALQDDTSCDAAIIGGGVSGAFAAWYLTEAGLDTLLLDRREIAHGSTAGNTGLVLWELDEPLYRLSRRIGDDAAARVFQRCRASIDVMADLVRDLRIECGFARRPSLYLAANKSHTSWLEREYRQRQAAGLPGAWWGRARIATECSLPHAAAICSPDGAEMDVYRFTYALLERAERAGARVYDRTAVTRWKRGSRGVELYTSRGSRVRARRLIVASGYESETFLPQRVGTLRSTFALVSEPMPAFKGWPPERCLIWDTGDPYYYLRRTEDGRAIIGGCDERFRDPRRRDRLLGAKVATLKRRFEKFFPELPLEVATAWAGTFGVTADGLPFIGQHPAVPHTWFVLGLGGNGTVFSLIAAEIVRDALVGRSDRDAHLFRFNR